MKKRIIIIPAIVFLLIGLAILLELYPSNKITGQATLQQFIENIPHNIVIGTYSIRPSFSIDLDYYLDVYDKIEEALKQISNSCSQEKDKEACVNTEMLKFNLKEGSNKPGFPLAIGCYEGDEGIFMDFLDYLSNCSSSTENNCECAHEHISQAEYKLSQDGSNIVVNTELNKNKYSVIIKNSKLSSQLTFSDTQNHRLARDQNGAILSVRKGALGKECDLKSYQRKIYALCYNTGKKLIVTDEKSNIVEKEHKIKFAIEFS